MQKTKPNDTGDDPYIFISYAHENTDEILPDIEFLRNQQLNIWYDEGITLGADWREELGSSILGSKLFILFISPVSSISNHCLGELHMALDNDVPVLAVHLDQVEMTPGLNLALGDRQQLLKYQFDQKTYQEKLLAGIQAILANPTSTFSTSSNYRMRPRAQTNRFWLAPIFAVLLAVVGFVIWNNINPSTGTDQAAAVNSIAVMPFLNLSQSSDDEYFSDGISEEILNKLSTVPGLTVTSRTSSFSLRDADLDIPAIGKRLHVSQVMEGSVRKMGNTVRITVQLVDASEGFRIWSSTYERELKDIFLIQEDIADSVVSALQIQIDKSPSQPAQQNRVVNVQAYDLYLLGRHSLNKRTATTITRSIELFEESISLDPDFALAYTGLADAYNLLTAYGNMSGPDAASRMRPYLDTALRLEPELAEIHNSLGAMYENLGDLDRAEAAYRKAISLNPNSALALMWLGNLLINESRLEEASKVYSESFRLDPLNEIVNLNVARVEMYRGHFGAGATTLDNAIQIQPLSPHGPTTKSFWLGQYGQFDEALRMARKAVELDNSGAQNLANIISAHMDLGDFDAAREWIEQAAIESPDYWKVVWITAEFHHFNSDYEMMEQYTQEKLAALLGSQQASRDLKVVYLWYGLTKLMKGQNQLAQDYLDRAADVDYQLNVGDELRFRVLRALAHQRSGDTVRARNLLDENLKYAQSMQAAGWNTPAFLTSHASVFAATGDRDRALELLSEARQLGFRKHLILEHDPSWDAIRKDIGFQNFVESLK